jgi:hypothetical protein
MAKAKKNVNDGRKKSSIKPLKRAPQALKRNTAIPKAAPRRAMTATPPSSPRAATTPVAAQRQTLPRVGGEITHDMIARRAYEIHLSGTGGSEFDNWCRAERELRGA